MMIDDNILLQRLRDEVGVPAGEDERLTVKLAAAKRYVAHAPPSMTICWPIASSPARRTCSTCVTRAWA